MATGYESDPPSDALVASMRAELAAAIARIFQFGNNKIARVRVEVEFGSGEELVHERVAAPLITWGAGT